MSEVYGVDAFIRDVRQVLETEGPTEAGLEQMAAHMRVLLRSPEILEGEEPAAGNIHDADRRPAESERRGPLYLGEDGLFLGRGRFSPNAMTPIHTHGAWGMVGVYKGRDLYQIWRRLDDGHGPGEARLELVEERILEPGEVAIIPPPPQDIHAQQGYDGDTVFELVLFGDNVMTKPRLYFDPEQQTAREVQLR